MAECPSCGRENPNDARFCSDCGEQLAAVALEQVRKTVTIVFCDLVGSTALGERLDPESVRRAIGRYFDEARVAIERHGGTVEKFIGDAVMSVFGIPRLHEDDALRAVRAAADLRDAVRSLGDDLEAELGVRIEARIGVATGEVVAGDHSAGHAFVTGDVVNVAARLEQAADANDVLLGERTHELVRDAVRAESAGPLELKGKSMPIAAWRLLEVKDPPASMARGIETPFVGRERELEALSAALKRAVESRSCQLCTLVGAPGIGKSRIADEFTAAARANGRRVVVGRCLPYGDGITFWPLREIVQAVGGVEKVSEVLGDGEDATLVAQRVAGAVGIAEPSGAPEETFWAFRRLFESIAREQPLIAVVDELQWAEPTLLDLLEYLVTFAANEPILLLCLTRPELFDERPSWAAPRRDATVVMLEPLAESESVTLVRALAATRGVPDADLDRILATAEGNPLFLEQLLAYAGDEDGDLAVPPTIQALLAARIDGLDTEERAVILRAAVEGKTFHRGAVAELLPERARPMLGARLISFARQELIRADRSQFPGDDGFRFGHSLIHNAAYEAAPKELRAEAHERYVVWLEQRAGEHVPEYEEILGYHLEQAHRLRLELGREDPTLATRASSRLGAAGERALARGDVPGSVKLLGRAVALGSASGGARAGLLYALGIARNEAGDLEGADEAFSDAIERAERDGDSKLVMRATLERVSLQELTGRATGDDVRAEVQRAIPVLEQFRDDAGLARAWLRLADSSDTFAESEAAAQQAFLHARRARRAREEEDALFARLSGALYGERPVAEVTQLCENVLPEADGPLAEVGTIEILAALKVRAGELAEGRELYRRADQLYRELGMKHREAVNWQCWGRSELATGHFELAETAFRQSIDAFQKMRDSWFVNAVREHLAHALCAQGRFDEADAALEGCAGILATSARARVLAARGDIDAALALAQEAVAMSSAVDWLEGRAQVLVSLAEVHRAASRRADEADALRGALELYERKGIAPAVERVRSRLDELEAIAAS